ncbi:heavy-metal-associated domain-containing protein [Bacteroidota bacterium]
MKSNNLKLTISLIVIYILSGSFNVSAQQSDKKTEIKIKTSAVCSMCKERIESNMAYEKGVSFVELDLETKMVSIRYRADKTNPDKLRQAIANIGYDADDVMANPKKYEKLPACCKKDAPPH